MRSGGGDGRQWRKCTPGAPSSEPDSRSKANDPFQETKKSREKIKKKGRTGLVANPSRERKCREKRHNVPLGGGPNEGRRLAHPANSGGKARLKVRVPAPTWKKRVAKKAGKSCTGASPDELWPISTETVRTSTYRRRRERRESYADG